MSMTQEQALKLLEHPIYKWSMDWDEREDGLNYTEAIEIAIAALRPVSREQVEKVWRGEWKENKNAAIESAICSKCKTVFQAYYGNYQFCPRCGAPMTDEAEDMMLKRMEEIYK